MKKQNYTPHSRKSCLAALNKLNIFHGLTNIQDFSHDWPLVHKALSKWETYLKINPYQPQSAGNFSSEALEHILNLRNSDTAEVLDQVIVVISCWTSLRAKDLTSILCKNVSDLPMDRKTPRRFKFYFDRTKADPTGQAPFHQREFFLPCICLERLNGNDWTAFRARVRSMELFEELEEEVEDFDRYPKRMRKM